LTSNREDNPYGIDLQRIIRTESYAQFYVFEKNRPDILLKLDFVNDYAPHFGDFHYDQVLGKTDSWRNILSNKITALYRYEPKDVVDIWALCNKFRFNWPEILTEAAQKESPIDPIIVSEILASFPENALDSLKWIISLSKDQVISDLKSIIDSILKGLDNDPGLF